MDLDDDRVEADRWLLGTSLAGQPVLQALEEYDRLGQKVFLRSYGFGPARQYYLLHRGQRYDSKAIVGAAHGYQFPGQPLRAADFSGGEATLASKLRSLGFEVVDDGVNWELTVGQALPRREVHRRYGGAPYGGIEPSRSTPNVLLFTNPASGEQHGYFDGWADDGCFHYTGEGQHDDQQFREGNKAVRNTLRGKLVGLPSGQQVARAMRVNALSNATLGLSNDPGWGGEAPLWYYILKEAELAPYNTQRLGAVGGRIMAETLVGLLQRDPNSYLYLDAAWKPAPTDRASHRPVRLR